jgi:two-component system invasion response regulator UvrY
MALRILLVDDNDRFLESAAQFLALEPRLEVVGRARSGREAIDFVRQVHPDLVLMDLAMPGMHGLEATRRIKAMPEPPAVVVLTLHDTPHDRAAAATTADGFVSKADLGSMLVPTIGRLFGLKPPGNHDDD